MVKYVNAAGLEELIASAKLPVFCDFWASWCGPCRMLAPVFEDLSDKYEGEAVFVKIDIDEEDSEAAAIKYGISSIPNIIVFKDGKPVANHLGFAPESVLDAFVQANL
ncbi:MAG: thioredoxin [Clostridia bacterium]|nr:thioredoxin [Clostridia bacterium]MBQ8876767.1 thioredoxin [Clostridia bacterium]